MHGLLFFPFKSLLLRLPCLRARTRTSAAADSSALPHKRSLSPSDPAVILTTRHGALGQPSIRVSVFGVCVWSVPNLSLCL